MTTMNRKRRLRSLLLLTISMTTGAASVESTTTNSPLHHEEDRQLEVFQGDGPCKCLPFDQLPPPPSSVQDITRGDLSGVDHSEYGIGCGSHDYRLPACNVPGSSAASWCRRAWCWVDPLQCSLLNKRSETFEGRWFSYAACRNVDFFSAEQRILSLDGKTIRIALNHNTGG
jgi:hypothetical protein